MQHVRNIAVVGSGPVGVITAIKLAKTLPSYVKIFLIDSGKIEVKLNLAAKLRKNSVNSRSIADSSLENMEKINKEIAPSALVGGYSNFWGGTWKVPAKYGLVYVNAFSELEELLTEVAGSIGGTYYSTLVRDGGSFCRCMNSLLDEQWIDTQIQIYESPLLLNEILDTSDHLKETITDYCAWNAITGLDYLKGFSNFNLLSDLWVEKFVETPDGVTVHTPGGLLEFDIAVLACGPVETSRLLLRSVPNFNQILLSDTQMSYSLMIRWPRKKFKNSLGLSHVSSETCFDGPTSVELHTQYYAHLYDNKDIVLSRLPGLLRLPMSFMLRLFNPFLIVAINYISSEVSGHLEVEKNRDNPNLIVISRTSSKIHRKTFSKIYKVLSKKLRHLGLLTSPWMVFHQEPGKSFHYGATRSKITDETGKVLGHKRCYASGAFSLPTIYPGPITSAAMSHGVLVANKIIEEFFSTT